MFVTVLLFSLLSLTTTVLSLICVDALNATTGNSRCKHCIHLSTFSFGTRSTTQKIRTHKSPDNQLTHQRVLHLTWKHLRSIYLFCLKAKLVSCCLPSAAPPPPAVDTCTPVDHEHQGLQPLHQRHQSPENKSRKGQASG